LLVKPFNLIGMKKVLISKPVLAALGSLSAAVLLYYTNPAITINSTGTNTSAAAERKFSTAINTILYDSVFYNEKGEEILKPLNRGIRLSFVIRTKETLNSLYSFTEQQGIKGIFPVDSVRWISASLADSVEEYIMNFKFSDPLVLNNIIPIENIDVLQSMFSNIMDNGEGGDHPFNNKEYGGIVNEDNTIDTVIGPPGTLCDSTYPTVSLPRKGKTEYHSHPSGCVGEIPDSNCLFKESPDYPRHTCFYPQGPSHIDQKAVGDNRTGYVFGMRSGLIYIYTSQGVVATLPIEIAKRKRVNNIMAR